MKSKATVAGPYQKALPAGRRASPPPGKGTAYENDEWAGGRC